MKTALSRIAEYLQNLREIFYCLRHRFFMAQLKSVLCRHYRKADAKDLGKPLDENSRVDRRLFNLYFRNYHFEKNFYTSYHALWKLFCAGKETAIPRKFYVYDIACGPYTATVALLNFLEQHGGLEGKSFSFNFCDKGSLVLERLYQANKDTAGIDFLIPCFWQIKSRFDLEERDICIRQCLYDSRWGCRVYQTEIGDKKAMSDCGEDDAVNLIFLSYPGVKYEEKFATCAAQTVSDFKPEQKRFPTYIIYAHYTGDEEMKDDFQELINFKVTSVTESQKRLLPFGDYYYYIYELETL